jgi:hypothetical protein
MKTKGKTSSQKAPEGINSSTKLASLLSLAAGAVAIPQTSEADVIMTDLSASPGHVGFLYSQQFTINNLPGTARMGFSFVQQGTTSTNYRRGVFASQVAGYVRLKTNASFVVHVPAGVSWNQAAGVASIYGLVGFAAYGNHTPNSYDHQYLLFRFQDSTQGNALRYGWAEVSLFNGNINVSEGPDVTVWRYAYDTSGNPLPSGQVPEPTPVALLALGALTLGSKGLRKWRAEKLEARG